MTRSITFTGKVGRDDKAAVRAAERLIAKHVSRQIAECIDREGAIGEDAVRYVIEWWQNVAKLAVRNATSDLLEAAAS